MTGCLPATRRRPSGARSLGIARQRPGLGLLPASSASAVCPTAAAQCRYSSCRRALSRPALRAGRGRRNLRHSRRHDPPACCRDGAHRLRRGNRARRSPWTDWAGRHHETMRGRPVSLHAMRGISAHSNGFQTCRALHLLQMLLGTIDVPGGWRYKSPHPKPAPPGPKPAGKPEQVASRQSRCPGFRSVTRCRPKT